MQIFCHLSFWRQHNIVRNTFFSPPSSPTLKLFPLPFRFFFLSFRFSSFPFYWPTRLFNRQFYVQRPFHLANRLNWARAFYHVTRVDYAISSRCLRAKCRIVFMPTIENGFWNVDNTTIIFVFRPALSYSGFISLFDWVNLIKTEMHCGNGDHAKVMSGYCILGARVGVGQIYVVIKCAGADEIMEKRRCRNRIWNQTWNSD